MTDLAVCELQDSRDGQLHLSEPGSCMSLCANPAGRVLRHFPPDRFGKAEMIGDPPEPDYLFCATCHQRAGSRLDSGRSRELREADRLLNEQRMVELEETLQEKGVLS